MPTWIRRQFTAAGLTQIPAGPHLGSLQGRYGGTVMLCIDVSGSMDGQPIREAVRGAREFVNEAVSAHYNVGVMLWNTQVVGAQRTDPGRRSGEAAARPRSTAHPAAMT